MPFFVLYVYKHIFIFSVEKDNASLLCTSTENVQTDKYSDTASLNTIHFSWAFTMQGFNIKCTANI